MLDLNFENELLYAIKNYNSLRCVMSEFEEDYLRFKYIKRLLKKYKTSGLLKERLLLNHLIILGNVFGVEPTVRLLFLKNDKSDYDTLKSFLIFLDYMPDIVKNINSYNILSTDIETDMIATEILKKI